MMMGRRSTPTVASSVQIAALAAVPKTPSASAQGVARGVSGDVDRKNPVPQDVEPRRRLLMATQEPGFRERRGKAQRMRHDDERIDEIAAADKQERQVS